MTLRLVVTGNAVHHGAPATEAEGVRCSQCGEVYISRWFLERHICRDRSAQRWGAAACLVGCVLCALLAAALSGR